jgi:hypothetical protein
MMTDLFEYTLDLYEFITRRPKNIGCFEERWPCAWRFNRRRMHLLELAAKFWSGACREERYEAPYEMHDKDKESLYKE